jgi:hypothetical protein
MSKSSNEVYCILGKLLGLTSTPISNLDILELRDRLETTSDLKLSLLDNAINEILDFLAPPDVEGTLIEKYIKDFTGRPKTNWAVICRGPYDMPEVEGCGRVYLSEEEYDLQMHPSMADKTWRCPECGCECWPDDNLMCDSDGDDYEHEEDAFLDECIKESKQEYFDSLVNAKI